MMGADIQAVNHMMFVVGDFCLLKRQLVLASKDFIISPPISSYSPLHLLGCLSHRFFGFTKGITLAQAEWKDRLCGLITGVLCRIEIEARVGWDDEDPAFWLLCCTPCVGSQLVTAGTK